MTTTGALPAAALGGEDHRDIRVHVLVGRNLRLSLVRGCGAKKGVIAVSMCNVPKTAHAGSVVWLQAASAHRRGWVADIEVLRPGATKWVWLKTDVTTTMVSLTPERAGTCSFRARVRDKAIKTASGFSPISKMHVS